MTDPALIADRGEAGRSGRRVDVPLELSLLAVSLAATLGSLRLVNQPPASLAWSVLACVVAGHAVTAAARRLPAPAPAPVAWGLVGVLLTASWTQLGSSTWWGIPTWTTVRFAADRLGDAARVLDGQSTPLPPSAGILFVFVLLAGAVAVAGRALLALSETSSRWRRAALICLVPSFVLFVYTAVLSSGRERISSTFAYLLASAAFVAAAETASARSRSERWARLGPGLGLGLLAWFVVLVASAVPAVSAINLHVFVHVVDSSGAGGGVPSASSGISGLELIDDLGAVETSRSNATAFVATSPFPTYWQVATLTRFDGRQWHPDGVTAALAGSAGSGDRATLPVLPEPVPDGPSLFDVTVSLQTLTSRLLPTPPGTVAIAEPGEPRFGSEIESIPAVGEVVAEPDAAAHLRYEAQARRPVSAAALPALPGVAPDPATSLPTVSISPYLALPRLPARVTALAHHIVAGTTTPAAAVLALESWFTSGAYRYTLSPPPLHGRNPLTTFLFTTRAGFCQQFAGAFAVLARADGLPTRIAVGFTPGSPVGDDTYLVSAIDAHVWPEVYLGPGAGWISVDPTPGDGSGVGPQPGPVSTGAVQSGTGLQHVRNPQLANGGAGSSTTVTTLPAGGTGALSGSAGSRAGLVVGLVAVAALIGAALFAATGRWRRRDRRGRRPGHAGRGRRGRAPGRHWLDSRGGSDARVLHSWRRAAGGFEPMGLGRLETESPTEHARRLQADERAPAFRGAITSYAQLAELAARASYAPDPCSDADVAEARALADAVASGTRR